MKFAPIDIDNDRIVAQIASGSGDRGEIFAQRRLPTGHEDRGHPRAHDFQHADGLFGIEHAREPRISPPAIFGSVGSSSPQPTIVAVTAAVIANCKTVRVSLVIVLELCPEVWY